MPTPLPPQSPVIPHPDARVPVEFTVDDKFIHAIIKTESGSKKFPDGNDYAHGDLHLKHQAYGCMQIRQPACDDVNKHYGTHLLSQQMLGNRPLSIDTFIRYQSIYNKDGNKESMARTWNGGPGWRRNPHLTDGYWSRVQKNMI